MRLQIIKSKNAASLYVVKSTYINGIHSSKVVEKLGSIADLKIKLDGQDPIEWANEYVKELTKREKDLSREILVRFAPNQIIDKDERRSFNGGYLFLQKIYHELGFDKICQAISAKRKFAFDLNSILSRLVFGRIIFPASKLSTHLLSKKFIEQPNFELQHIYRALEVISKETDIIQSELYKNSSKLFKRQTGILYYDCTNYFFEIEQEDGIKQFGYAKQHKPNPLVQMGLFMDAGGIPLAFCIHPGNTNEQITLKPLEQKILSDFNLSKFIVCTDAGLASDTNRKFNDKADRAFITTQSIKKLKKFLKDWALDNTNWHIDGDLKTYDITTLDEEKYRDKTFYKERWIKENGLEQRLIVTYSIKYRDYQRNIRDKQVARAIKLIDTNPQKLTKVNQNDYKRFISKISRTRTGEEAKIEDFSIDTKLISQEEVFDGFYGVCTNLEDAAAEIIKINHQRWKIEECFRIMKSEFRARPVYLSRDDRIKAHFTTCFIALIIFRLLEKKLGEQFTCHEIIDGLCNMNFYNVQGEGYVPTYTRSDLTDALHDAFGFRTDYQIVVSKQMKNIFKATKN